MTSELDALMFEMFRAGWRMSDEGFNHGYGGPDDDSEWFYHHYLHEVHGGPEPRGCPSHAPQLKEHAYAIGYRFGMSDPCCLRPAGHKGSHRYEDGHHEPLEWEDA